MNGQHAFVVGGGVIGIACADYLQRAGYRVTVTDRSRVGAACSHGNCGLICPSHVLPLAEPGAVRDALKAILNRNGPFRIGLRWDRHLWRWFRTFAFRCNERDMLESGHAIQPLLTSSLQLYRELIETSQFDCGWEKQGLLFAYRSERPWKEYASVNRLLTEKFHESARPLTGPELAEFEPSLKSELAGAWYFEHDAHLQPNFLLRDWRKHLEAKGVRFWEERPLIGFSPPQGEVRAAHLAGVAEPVSADLFVIATGAWTPQLAEILRCRIPIEPGKGYSLMVPHLPHTPRVPMIFPEHRVAVTPMVSGVRIGSMMEFVGYDAQISPERLRLLTAGASHYLRDPIPENFTNPWYGWRPMTTDSVPVIGKSPGFQNVYLAVGHNMLGLSMAPATGKLIGELVTGEVPHISPAPYRPERLLAFKS